MSDVFRAMQVLAATAGKGLHEIPHVLVILGESLATVGNSIARLTWITRLTWHLLYCLQIVYQLPLV